MSKHGPVGEDVKSGADWLLLLFFKALLAAQSARLIIIDLERQFAEPGRQIGRLKARLAEAGAFRAALFRRAESANRELTGSIGRLASRSADMTRRVAAESVSHHAVRGHVSARMTAVHETAALLKRRTLSRAGHKSPLGRSQTLNLGEPGQHPSLVRPRQELRLPV